MPGKHRSDVGGSGSAPELVRRSGYQAVELEVRWSPDPEDVEDWPFVMDVLDVGRLIGRQGLDRYTGRLVEFAITAQVHVSGGWKDVARVDTAHEEVHFHLMSIYGGYLNRRVLRPIFGPQDVHRGWDEGMDTLTDTWEENERRWRSGR